uniref:Uncharacterized protein n=1 Tax=Arundo donax TaxID=35708 RepID=A0A0A8YFA4_ARUDO
MPFFLRVAPPEMAYCIHHIITTFFWQQET